MIENLKVSEMKIGLAPFATLLLIILASTAIAEVASFEKVYPHRIATKSDKFIAKWRFNAKRDGFDDAAILSAQSSSPSGGTISFYCIGGNQLIVQFTPEEPIFAFSPVTVKWRADKQKALTQDWEITSDREALGARGGIAHGMALAVMQATHSLLIGVKGQTARFWLEGARLSVAKVLKGCGRS